MKIEIYELEWSGRGWINGQMVDEAFSEKELLQRPGLRPGVYLFLKFEGGRIFHTILDLRETEKEIERDV
jgi:hypothetical protein